MICINSIQAADSSDSLIRSPSERENTENQI